MAQRGRARDRAEAFLPLEIVHFEHDAVDLVRRAARVAPAAVRRTRSSRPRLRTTARSGLTLQTPLLQRAQHIALRRRRERRLDEADAVAEEVQRPPRGDARIQLPQAAGRAVARIHHRLVAAFDGPRVERSKGLDRQIDFAAHFERGRRPLAAQLQRDGPDGAHIRGDVLALLAVAARRAELRARRFRTCRLTAMPSIFGSHEYSRTSSVASRVRQRASHAAISSSVVHLSSDSIGSRWTTVPNWPCGVDPTRCVGESGVTSSGCSASSARRRSNNASYSPSRYFGIVEDVVAVVVVVDRVAQRCDLVVHLAGSLHCGTPGVRPVATSACARSLRCARDSAESSGWSSPTTARPSDRRPTRPLRRESPRACLRTLRAAGQGRACA